MAWAAIIAEWRTGGALKSIRIANNVLKSYNFRLSVGV